MRHLVPRRPRRLTDPPLRPRVELHLVSLRGTLTGQRDPAVNGLRRRLLRPTRGEAENGIFTYIDGWYNTRRIQRELGYLRPNEYETAWHPRDARINRHRGSG
ncbi:IS3 family transposase [Micromonospora sp. NPDC002575]|uniref:IS3 family transposase n=1 Tax=Micromonospora sp. NPDC002575 TaxID=3364222 RepID=UPI0036A46082